MMLGQEVMTQVDLQFPIAREHHGDVTDFVQELREQLHRCYQDARNNLRRAASTQNKHHNTRIVQHRYNPGDVVFKKSIKKHKFSPQYEGPFVILKVLSDCLYTIATKSKTYAIHHDRLKPYLAGTYPKWVKEVQNKVNPVG